jgi:glycosyltransferase involved in cell wall biosynthesis
LFVGRITRQKGIIHLVNAIRHFDPGFQVVLCAGAPDTPEIAAEMRAAVEAAQAARPGVIWIDQMVDKSTVYELYTHAAVFCCPSIYEPFGIINLEAMACETAVVASAVGGIKEVVREGETGQISLPGSTNSCRIRNCAPRWGARVENAPRSIFRGRQLRGKPRTCTGPL